METIGDIINAMQQASKLLGGETGGIIRMYADRIEKALAATSKESLQVGNTAKMREALDEIIDTINKWRTDGAKNDTATISKRSD